MELPAEMLRSAQRAAKLPALVGSPAEKLRSNLKPWDELKRLEPLDQERVLVVPWLVQQRMWRRIWLPTSLRDVLAQKSPDLMDEEAAAEGDLRCCYEPE